MSNELSAFRERVRVFIAAIASGASDKSAAAEAGISRASIHRWQHGERPFDETMRKQMARARAVRERQWIEAIKGAATTPLNNGSPGDWRAAAWLLERTNREDYGAPSRVEVSGPGGGPMRIEQDVEHRLALPDPDRVQKVMALLVRAGAVPQLESTNGNGNGSHGDGPS